VSVVDIALQDLIASPPASILSSLNTFISPALLTVWVVTVLVLASAASACTAGLVEAFLHDHRSALVSPWPSMQTVGLRFLLRHTHLVIGVLFVVLELLQAAVDVSVSIPAFPVVQLAELVPP